MIDATKPDPLTIRETAIRLRVSVQTVRTLIRSHRLAAAKVGSQWCIGREVVEAMLRPEEAPDEA